MFNYSLNRKSDGDLGDLSLLKVGMRGELVPRAEKLGRPEEICEDNESSQLKLANSIL